MSTSPGSDDSVPAQSEFQEMVRMRKEEVRERTESRRQETVKLLEARKLRNEKESEAKIFGLPNEIWCEILSFVEDPNDVGSMWKVHPRFRDLSEESQTNECLLSRLLKIDKLPHLCEDCKEKLATYKLLRSVSRGMRIAVDRCIEKDFMKALHGHKELSYYYSIDFAVRNQNNWELFGKMLKDFTGDTVAERAKHVFHRSIELCMYPNWMDDTRFNDFSWRLGQLLDTIGNQIWYCSLQFPYIDRQEANGTSLTDVYNFCRRVVFHMPNLKWLEIDFCFRKSDRDEKTEIDAATLFNRPFPHLRHLERVKLGHFRKCEQKYEIVRAVLRLNSHIKILESDGFLDSMENQEQLCADMKGLLSKLNLNAIYYGNQWNDITIEIMQPLINKDWKLHFLSFGFTENSLKPVFEVVNKIPTLEHLKIHALNISLGDELPSLELPNLTHFDMQFRANLTGRRGRIESSTSANVFRFMSLEFLQLSEKLKKLFWSTRFPHRYAQKKFERFMIGRARHFEDFIDFSGGFGDLSSSNIWDVFPQLEYVKTRVFVDA